jgi:type II secretory pathway pseudopilin PulG
LVELLVVVGIIAVLISLLLPSLNRVRAQAQSTQCLSNLRQIGQICHMYASENKGYLPPAIVDSIENIAGGTPISNPGGTPNPGPSHPLKQLLFRYTQGGTMIFYCPSNDLWTDNDNGTVTTAGTPPLVLNKHDPARFEEYPVFADNSNIAIRYWYMGNPWRQSGPNVTAGDIPLAAPRGYKQWLDVMPEPTGNGETRDEYMCREGEKNSWDICIATDQTRQAAAATGWSFFHGTRQNLGQNETNSSRMRASWKNNLDGDVHCESKHADEIKPRWSSTNPAAW